MKKELEIQLTPEELSEVFVNWCSSEQAKFLDLVGAHFKAVDWPSEMQVASIADELSRNASDWIYTLANFMKVRGLNYGSPKHEWLLDFYPSNGVKA